MKLNFIPGFLFIFFMACQPTNKTGNYNILDFGAQPGKLCTQAIQKAINTCYHSGGGTVLIPPGEFVTGTIILKSNCHLHLQSGAVLKGSYDTADYRIGNIKHGMIYAHQAVNISVTGRGVIDGNGTSFMDPERSHVSMDFDRLFTRQKEQFMPEGTLFEDGPVAYDYRPGMMMVLLSCENVLVRDITFKDSPSWTLRFGECDGVKVDNITILNNIMIPNSDGIHCTASRNIRISNCDIRAGDDAIIVTGFPNEIGVHGNDEERDARDVVRTGNKTGYAENVTVTNCVLSSRSAGIRIGYGEYPIRNCTFENLVIYDSNRGIGIFARDNATIENILFNNLVIQTRLHSGHWWGKGEPIHISSIRQNKDIPSGKITGIRITNVTAQSEAGMVIWAHEPGLIEDIQLHHIDLTVLESVLAESYGGNIDLRPVFSKEYGIFSYNLPGILANKINQLELNEIKVKWSSNPGSYFSEAIALLVCNQVEIRSFTGAASRRDGDLADIYLSEVNGYHLSDCRKPEGAPSTVQLNDCKK